MKQKLLLLTLLFATLFSSAQEFITTWKTDNPGTSNSTSITIPTFLGEAYSYDVDWNNDGNYDFVDIGYTGSVTHDFGTPGTYTIRIRGTFPRIYFNFGGDAQKIISVNQWGNITWSSMENAFWGCSNIAGNASDIPNLSNVTSLRRMFSNCTSFNQDISNWNVSTITDFSISLGGAISFNQDLSAWNVSNGTNFSGMFFEAISFNQDISGWNTGNSTNMSNMFNNATAFDQNIGGWNVESVLNFQLMFDGITLSTTNYDALLIGWDSQNLQQNMVFNAGNSTYCSGTTARTNMITSNGWTISDGGEYCGFKTTWKTDNPGTSSSTSITIPTFSGETYNYDVDWDNDGIFDDLGVTGDITHDYGVAGTYIINIKGLFPRIYFNFGGDVQKIITINQWGTNNWTSMERAFGGATNLMGNAMDKPDLSNVLSLKNMFTNASVFNQDIGDWDTSNIFDMTGMFANASSFNQDIGDWDVSLVGNMTSMFASASSFNQDLSLWNTSNVSSFVGMFTFATSFNQDIGDWDTSSATTMRLMFADATSFDQDLSNWNIENINASPTPTFSLGFMFRNVQLSNSNYDALLISWDAQNVNPNLEFDGGNSQYCSTAAITARANMIASDGWAITDGGQFAGSCTLGVEDVELKNNISLFPNPSNNNFVINGLEEESKVTIFDITGKQVYENANYNSGTEIRTDKLISGLYIVNIKTTSGGLSLKLVKK